VFDPTSSTNKSLSGRCIMYSVGSPRLHADALQFLLPCSATTSNSPWMQCLCRPCVDRSHHTKS
jgi:hypothetical protein